ncbi:hypothetical protein QVD99_003197 [Batrachochytrium dendrobatidis]|nr:hypothetical protein QVD99_003197 [Batrachochytrium dendrobatidis]
MKLPIAVLSSILLVCSVTIANPVFSTVATTPKYGPSSNPNTSGINLSSRVPLSAKTKNFLREYSKRKHDHDRHTKECELIDLQLEDQQNLVKRLGERFGNLRLEFHKNSRDRSKYMDMMKKLEREIAEGYSKLADLQRKKNKCVFEQTHVNQQLDFAKINLIKLVSRKTLDLESLDSQLLPILSHPPVKQYLEGLCGGEQSSTCSDEQQKQRFTLEELNFEDFEDIDLNDPSDEKQRQNPQPQSGFSSFGQRFTSLGERAYSGVRNVVSRLGDGLRSLVERLRCGNRSEC